MFNKLLGLVFILFISTSLLAQIAHIKNALQDDKLSIDKRIDYLIKISKAYENEQQDSAIVYADLAYSLSQNGKNKISFANAIIQKSNILINLSKEEDAINILEKALAIGFQEKNKSLEATVYNVLGKAFNKKPDSAILYYNKSIVLAKELKDKDLIIKNKIRIALILLHQKRHQELAKLFDKIIPELQKSNDINSLIEVYTYMAFAFRDLGEQEKALYYAEKSLDFTEKSDNKRLKAFVFSSIGSGITSYFKTFEEAIPLVSKGLAFATEINDKTLIQDCKKRLAILYYNNDEYGKAAAIVDNLLPTTKDPDIIELKASILYENKNYVEADKYFAKAYKLYEKDKAYIQQKLLLQNKIDNKLASIGDESLTRDFTLLDSLSTLIYDTESTEQLFDLETKYRTLEKEAVINKKELALAQSKLKIWYISGLALLLLIVWFFSILFLRNKHKRKDLEDANLILELKHNLNTSELSNINNQLNPHEIKNLITSFAPDLITKAPDAYKKMIKLFNVTRASLSDKITEPLEIQLQQANDYLELQQSISPYPWEFNFEINLEQLDFELPRLLLKNMVENAVKYGMKSLKENGQIILTANIIQQKLEIIIKDNGIGLNSNKPSESTGIGLASYKRFFELINAHNKKKASLALKRENAWTIVEISIPLEYQY
ncbi:MAG: histidine kinase [Chitinophagales bacterium]